jgi:hypothetical protein
MTRYISGSYASKEQDPSISLSFMTLLNLSSLKVIAFYWSYIEELASGANSSRFPQIGLNTGHTKAT